jgi:IS5 family transposase
MSSTKKNNKWHFGAKGHIGVQANGKPLIHSVAFTTAKEADINGLDSLLHGEEQAVFGDSGYTKRADKEMARAVDVYYGVHDRGARNHPLSSSQKKRNKRHSRLRAKVEHPFRVIKVLWNQAKLRYKGLEKNASRFKSLCALCNIYMCRKLLIA